MEALARIDQRQLATGFSRPNWWRQLIEICAPAGLFEPVSQTVLVNKQLSLLGVCRVQGACSSSSFFVLLILLFTKETVQTEEEVNAASHRTESL